MDSNFRRLDVDHLSDPGAKFLTLQDLLPPLPPVSLADMQARAAEVKALMSKGDYGAALTVAVEDAPYGGDEKTKVYFLSAHQANPPCLFFLVPTRHYCWPAQNLQLLS